MAILLHPLALPDRNDVLARRRNQQWYQQVDTCNQAIEQVSELCASDISMDDEWVPQHTKFWRIVAERNLHRGANADVP